MKWFGGTVLAAIIGGTFVLSFVNKPLNYLIRVWVFRERVEDYVLVDDSLFLYSGKNTEMSRRRFPRGVRRLAVIQGDFIKGGKGLETIVGTTSDSVATLSKDHPQAHLYLFDSKGAEIATASAIPERTPYPVTSLSGKWVVESIHAEDFDGDGLVEFAVHTGDAHKFCRRIALFEINRKTKKLEIATVTDGRGKTRKAEYFHPGVIVGVSVCHDRKRGKTGLAFIGVNNHIYKVLDRDDSVPRPFFGIVGYLDGDQIWGSAPPQFSEDSSDGKDGGHRWYLYDTRDQEYPRSVEAIERNGDLLVWARFKKTRDFFLDFNGEISAVDLGSEWQASEASGEHLTLQKWETQSP